VENFAVQVAAIQMLSFNEAKKLLAAESKLSEWMQN
jgi:hypothetical protein